MDLAADTAGERGRREAGRGVNSRCSFASHSKEGGREGGKEGGPLLFTSASGSAASPACSKEIVFHPSRNEKGASERGREGERERGREGAVMSSSPLIAAVPVLVASASAVAVI